MKAQLAFSLEATLKSCQPESANTQPTWAVRNLLGSAGVLECVTMQADTARLTRGILVVGLIAALSACGSGNNAVKNDALGQACGRVNDGIGSVGSHRGVAGFASSASRWSASDDDSVRQALTPLASSARQWANAPRANRVSESKQFWRTFGQVVRICAANGSPLSP